MNEPRETQPDDGAAGASAMREYERRRSNREQRVRRNHPRIGGLLLAVKDAPSHETVWARGAIGEQRAGIAIARPRALARRINASGPIPHHEVRELAAQLARALPSA